MATDQGGGPRRRIDPLVGVVTDGVALGYQALDLVMEGLRESLRIQRPPAQTPPAYGRPPRPYPRSRRPYGRSARAYGRPPRIYGQQTVPLGHHQAQSGPPPETHPGAGAAASSGALIADLAGIASELLNRAGAVAAEVASAAGARSGQAAESPTIPELVATATAGGTATVEFCVWNTGPTALREVTLNGTALIGPGRNAKVKIAVEVPDDTEPGNYRGLVQAEPGDICTVLMVCVSAASDPPPKS